MNIAIYPGTFDPITKGHLDIATRAARIFDKLVIGVYSNSNKHLLFNTEERVELVRQAIVGLPNVDAVSFTGLTAKFAASVGAKVMVRGLRASADFEREFEMAMMNKKLAPGLELVCFMASLQYQFLASSLLKEVAKLEGCLDNMVPAHVVAALRDKFARELCRE